MDYNFFLEEQYKIACAQNGLASEYDEQTEEQCKIACAQNGLALRFVYDQTEEICKIACAQNGLALEYVLNQTEEICKIACAQNGLALRFVYDQTEEICKIACAQNGWALYNCDVISPECLVLAKDCLKDVYTVLSDRDKSDVRDLATTCANWPVFTNGTRDMLCADVCENIMRFI